MATFSGDALDPALKDVIYRSVVDQFAQEAKVGSTMSGQSMTQAILTLDDTDDYCSLPMNDVVRLMACVEHLRQGLGHGCWWWDKQSQIIKFGLEVDGSKKILAQGIGIVSQYYDLRFRDNRVTDAPKCTCGHIEDWHVSRGPMLDLNCHIVDCTCKMFSVPTVAIATRQTYFQVLGVPMTASTALIRRAYIEMCKRVHPDKGGTQDEFLVVKEAYECLSNELRRKKYLFALKLEGQTQKQSDYDPYRPFASTSGSYSVKTTAVCFTPTPAEEAEAERQRQYWYANKPLPIEAVRRHEEDRRRLEQQRMLEQQAREEYYAVRMRPEPWMDRAMQEEHVRELDRQVPPLSSDPTTASKRSLKDVLTRKKKASK